MTNKFLKNINLNQLKADFLINGYDYAGLAEKYSIKYHQAKIAVKLATRLVPKKQREIQCIYQPITMVDLELDLIRSLMDGSMSEWDLVNKYSIRPELLENLISVARETRHDQYSYRLVDGSAKIFFTPNEQEYEEYYTTIKQNKKINDSYESQYLLITEE